MEIAKILVGSTSGGCLKRSRIPAGRVVGLTVSVEFGDPIWDDMIKTVVFRGTGSRIADFDGKTAVIPWEILAEPGTRIYFGIYGHNPETGLQIPLIEVNIGETEKATDPQTDPGTDPTLPIWAQLQEEIEQLKKSGVSDEKIAQAVGAYLEKNPPTVTETDPTVPAWAKTEGKPSYTADEVGALSEAALPGAVNDALAQAKASGEFDGAPGQDYILTEEDKAAIAEMAADLVEVPDSGGNVDQGGGLSTTASALLITILRNGVYSTDQSANITALAAELSATEPEEPDNPDIPDEPGKTLELISATYSGGDVPIGTAVSELTGIVVTAYYSDGTSAIVTGYTLSGTIAEGKNTVTVSYGGKTTTFTVTGVAESGGDTNEGNLIDFYGDTIALELSNTITTVNSNSIVVAGSSYSCIIVNGITPGAQYAINYEGGGRITLCGSILDNITAEPTDIITIESHIGGISETDRPHTFTAPFGCRAFLIYLYSGAWTNMVLEKVADPVLGDPYELTLIENEYPDRTTGEIKSYSGWHRTDYLPCVGVVKLLAHQAGDARNSNDNVFYDENKNYISSFTIPTPHSNGGQYVGAITVPDNAHYFILSGVEKLMNNLTVIPVLEEA